MNFKFTDMKWIKEILGINKIVEKQEEANELLKELIRLKKHSIDNDCEPFSRKRRAR